MSNRQFTQNGNYQSVHSAGSALLSKAELYSIFNVQRNIEQHILQK
jgi:hypothetical protein